MASCFRVALVEKTTGVVCHRDGTRWVSGQERHDHEFARRKEAADFCLWLRQSSAHFDAYLIDEDGRWSYVV